MLCDAGFECRGPLVNVGLPIVDGWCEIVFAISPQVSHVIEGTYSGEPRLVGRVKLRTSQQLIECWDSHTHY